MDVFDLLVEDHDVSALDFGCLDFVLDQFFSDGSVVLLLPVPAVGVPDRACALNFLCHKFEYLNIISRRKRTFDFILYEPYTVNRSIVA